MKSEKKTYPKHSKRLNSKSYIGLFIEGFRKYFISHRFDNTNTAKNYIIGLLKCEKGQANMERIEEAINKSEYQVYQQFITNSNWNSAGLQESVALKASEVLNNHKKKSKLPTGYIIDESSHLKKGKMSVGVSRQYAGVSGKVDNSQVAVYSSMVNEKYATIINERLFLPKSWTGSKGRCKKAGIPEAFMTYKTKPELALEMIKQDIDRGVKFDWIGGDGLYGHNSKLCQSLDDIGQFYVLDVHKDDRVYMEEPSISIPKRKEGSGRKPTRLKADKKLIRLDVLLKTIKEEQWSLEEIRDTTKGKLKLYICKMKVWTWDGKEKKARAQTLIITKTKETKPKIKYSISNGGVDEYTSQEYGYFVSQRYWVERTFDNAKNELGLSDYQIRKWKAFHHHHSLMMLASLFIMEEQMRNHPQVPLLSFRDARILVIVQLFGSDEDLALRLKQMDRRHTKRKYDIDLCFRKQREKDEILTS